MFDEGLAGVALYLMMLSRLHKLPDHACSSAMPTSCQTRWSVLPFFSSARPPRLTTLRVVQLPSRPGSLGRSLDSVHRSSTQDLAASEQDTAVRGWLHESTGGGAETRPGPPEAGAQQLQRQQRRQQQWQQEPDRSRSAEQAPPGDGLR